MVMANGNCRYSRTTSESQCKDNYSGIPGKSLVFRKARQKTVNGDHGFTLWIVFFIMQVSVFTVIEAIKTDDKLALESKTINDNEDFVVPTEHRIKYDFTRENMHLYAITGHHFNRSLSEEIKLFDSSLLPPNYKIQVHFSSRRHPSSKWMIYTEENELLQGVPLAQHQGLHSFYFTVTNTDSPSFGVTLPCAVEVVTEEAADELHHQGIGKGQMNIIDLPLACHHSEPVTIATVTLDAPSELINHIDRLNCVRRIELYFNVLPKDVVFHTSPNSDGHNRPILSGPGNAPKVRVHRGDRDVSPSASLSWPLGCNSDIIGDIPNLDKLETSAVDGSLARALGYDISEWFITNSVSHIRRHRRAKRLIQGSAPTSHRNSHPQSRKWRRESGDHPGSTDIPNNGDDLPKKRRGRTRVSADAIKATPIVEVPVRASKVTNSPVDRNSQIPRSTPSIEPPSTMPVSGNFLNNNPPMFLFGMSDITARLGTYMEFRIPNDVFYDNEDGMTWDMNLTVYDERTLEEVQKDRTWLMFDKESQLLYGVPDETAVADRGLVLLARDSGGKSASHNFRLTINIAAGKPKPVSHTITFTFSKAPESSSQNALFSIFGRKLVVAMAKGKRMPGDLVMMNTGLDQSNFRCINWFDNSINSESECQSAEIRQAATLMIGEDAGEGQNYPAPEFANKFSPDYELKSINIQLSGPCIKYVTTTTATTTSTTVSSVTALKVTLTPPASKSMASNHTVMPEQTTKEETLYSTVVAVGTIKNNVAISSSTTQRAETESIPQLITKPLPRIAAQTGKVSRFTIPNSIFTEQQTLGSKPKIQLKDSSIKWIALDSKTDTLYIIPTRTDVTELEDYNSTHKLWSGNLVAKSNEGMNSVTFDLKVLVQKETGVKKEPNHRFRLKIENYDIESFAASDRMRLLLAIDHIFHDSKGGQTYLHPIEKGSVIVSWYNTTLGSVQPCPYNDIAELAKSIFDGTQMKGDVKKIFNNYNFTITRMELSRTSSCPKSISESTSKSPDIDIAAAGVEGKSTTIIIIAVIVVCLVILIVILVVKCRMMPSSKEKKEEKKEKLVREEAAIAAGNPDLSETPRIRKGVPIIFRDEIALESNGNASTSVTTPLISRRTTGNSSNPAGSASEENVHEETPFTSPTTVQPMTPPTPIMSNRPPPPYTKTR